jgi:hypothetical protein
MTSLVKPGGENRISRIGFQFFPPIPSNRKIKNGAKMQSFESFVSSTPLSFIRTAVVVEMVYHENDTASFMYHIKSKKGAMSFKTHSVLA